MKSKNTSKDLFRQKIRKTLSDPSTIEKHMNAETNQSKGKDKGTTKLKKKGAKQNAKMLNLDSSK